MIYYRIKDLTNHDIISTVEEDSNNIRLNPNRKELIVQILNKLPKLRNKHE